MRKAFFVLAIFVLIQSQLIWADNKQEKSHKTFSNDRFLFMHNAPIVIDGSESEVWLLFDKKTGKTWYAIPQIETKKNTGITWLQVIMPDTNKKQGISKKKSSAQK